jgi:hypothetical protein
MQARETIMLGIERAYSIMMPRLDTMANTCNPSYFGDRDQENCSTKPTWTKKLLWRQRSREL